MRVEKICERAVNHLLPEMPHGITSIVSRWCEGSLAKQKAKENAKLGIKNQKAPRLSTGHFTNGTCSGVSPSNSRMPNRAGT